MIRDLQIQKTPDSVLDARIRFMVSSEKLEILRRYSHRTEGSRLRAADKTIQKIIEFRIASRIRIVNISGKEGDRDAKRIRDQLQFVISRFIFTT